MQIEIDDETAERWKAAAGGHLEGFIRSCVEIQIMEIAKAKYEKAKRLENSTNAR